jgi:hypothetical protein
LFVPFVLTQKEPKSQVITMLRPALPVFNPPAASYAFGAPSQKLSRHSRLYPGPLVMTFYPVLFCILLGITVILNPIIKVQTIARVRDGNACLPQAGIQAKA